jgi:hypothetical protein
MKIIYAPDCWKTNPIKPNTNPKQTQYKPNSLDAQMNVTSILTNHYENEPRLRTLGKQTQSNPFFTNFCQIFTVFYSFFSRSLQKTCAFGTNFLTKSQKTSQK